jgi:predicted Zn-dependent protease
LERDRSFVLGTLRARELVSTYGELNDPLCATYLTTLLRTIVGDEGRDLRVRILSTHEAFALVPGNSEILISAGLIKALQSEAEAAFLLTHEAGHIVLRHRLTSGDYSALEDPEERRSLELAADRFALSKLDRAGYNTAAALTALTRGYHASSKREDTRDYPSFSERINQISKQALSTPQYGRGLDDRRDFQRCRRSL